MLAPPRLVISGDLFGDAETGVDYTHSVMYPDPNNDPWSLYFAPGHSSAYVTVNALQDTRLEGDETIELEISYDNGQGACNVATTAPIADDDRDRVRLTTLDFHATLPLLRDPIAGEADFLYSAEPAWKDVDADGDVSDELDHSHPVAYVRGNPVKVSGVFKLNGVAIADGARFKVRIRATGNVSVPNFTPTINAAGTELTFTEKTSAAPLSNSVDFLPEFTLNWEISMDFGVSWASAGSTVNELYQTLRSPTQIGTWDQPLYETTVWLGCKFAALTATEHDFVDCAWQNFTTRQVTRRDGEALKYWASDTNVATVKEMLITKNGQCSAWAKLWISVLAVQGVESNLVEITPDLSKIGIPGELPEGYMGVPVYHLLIKSWSFEGHGVERGLDAYRYQAGVDATPGSTMDAQNSGNSPSRFGSHVIARHAGKYYDPSYGSRHLTAAEWENASLAGFSVSLRKLGQADPNFYIRKLSATTSDVETVFDHF